MEQDLLRIWWSDSLEISLLSIPKSMRIKLGEKWDESRISIEKAPQTLKDMVAKLDTENLLPPPYIDSSTGIRRFSYKELVYLNILLTIDSFNLNTNKIRTKLFSFFSQEYTKEKAELIYAIEWLDAFITVYSGVEIEFIVDHQDISVFDPVNGSFFMTKPTTGQVRISLSVIINDVNKKLNLKPVKIKRNFGSLPLENAEVDIVLNTRALKSASEESIHISKTNADKTLVELSKIEELEPNSTVNDISKKHMEILKDNPYTTIETIEGDNKVVKIKKKTQKLYE